MSEQIISINPGRILFGLSRIGYNTASAICDIIDNSVRAMAKKVVVEIVKDRNDYSDAKRNNVKEYLIIDNGEGMDEAGIINCLTLGSSADAYEPNSLSKFGLGLKSAAFSQGDELIIISSDGKAPFSKFSVNINEIINRGEYFATKIQLDDRDNQVIAKYLTVGHGTIVILSKIRKINHPSVKNTLKELNLKAGVIYYKFLRTDVSITIDNKLIDGIDPLFSEESTGNLDENMWDGRTVKTIEPKTELVLDAELGVKCTIEITQLPYPPLFKILPVDRKTDADIREKYLINAGNYGFYVYRNSRLIAWASSLDGIIPQDQDFYSFRGRIDINDSADDYFNIDIKKSTITISDEAFRVISDFSQAAKLKSRRAWIHAGRLVKDLTTKGANELANSIVEDLEPLDLLPGDEEKNPEEVAIREEQIINDMKSNIVEIVEQYRNDLGIDEIVEEENLTLEDKLTALKGGDNVKGNNIFKVTSIVDNLLWEPYYDADLKNCVRINKLHRFARYIFESNDSNKDLQIIFEIFLLQLAEAEVYAYKNIDGVDYENLRKILSEYRRISSEFLANLIRRVGDQMPPFVNQEFE